MRLSIIAGNWKMNTSVEEALTLVGAMRAGLETVDGVEKVVCPPFVSLSSVSEVLRGSSIQVGAQNMYFEEKGAFTGEVSPRMLTGLCQFVILGHSERRQYFSEADEVINKKVHSALRAGLRPILCVGERLEEREARRTEEVIARQVRRGLERVTSWEPLVIAYEPIWAIGTGRAATGLQANETIALIRRLLADLFGETPAQEVRIQYGGSVTKANIAEFASQPDIDGALVGGASLNPEEFVAIVSATARAKGG